MRNHFILFLLAFTVATGFTVKENGLRTPVARTAGLGDTLFIQHVDTFLVGDINGDKVRDTAFQYSPFLIDPSDTAFNGCKDNDCAAIIQFSCKVNSILSDDNLWGDITALDDLDGDGFAEILVHPGWFIGCWERLLVYSWNGKNWKVVGKVKFFGCEEPNYDYSQHVVVKGKKTVYLVGEELTEDGNIQKERLKLNFEH